MWYGSMGILELLVFIAWFSFLPYTLLLIVGLMCKKKRKGRSLKNPRFIFQITTTGRNPRAVRKAVDSIHRSVESPSYQIWVVTEPEDDNQYLGAEKIVVPSDYRTKNITRMKARALEYSSELRRERGFCSKRDWVVFMDDDNLFTPEYFQAIKRMNPLSVGGQGFLVMANEWGRHLFSSLADNCRPTICLGFCSFFNRRGGPMLTHGEGLVVRADIEQKIGWDFGATLIEDFIFGRRIARGFPGRFEWLDACMELKSPPCSRDFFKQRRRWLWGFIKYFPRFGRREKAWILFMYGGALFGVVSLLGIVMDLLGMLSFPFLVRLLFILNMLGFLFYYQVGCWFNSRKLERWKRVKYHLLQLILQWVISSYEIGTFALALLSGGPKGFEVIRKE